MSGHSKWATIHRQKEVNDAKRSQQFTKVGMAITVAVREGRGVAEAIDKARAVNMPKENIQRAIERGKGMGAGGQALEEVLYEGYGPEGVGVLVVVVTDNKQRTAQVIKNIFDRSGGSLAGPGAVAFQFQKVGSILVSKKPPIDEQILSIIDLGADDVEEVDDGLEVTVALGKMEEAKKALAERGYVVIQGEQAQKPTTSIPVSQERAKKVIGLLESLEELDDVQKVWTNAEFAVWS